MSGTSVGYQYRAEGLFTKVSRRTSPPKLSGHCLLSRRHKDHTWGADSRLATSLIEMPLQEVEITM